MSIRHVVTFLSICVSVIAAGSLATAAGVPDILGIRPGMPIQEAVKILRAHDPKGLLTLAQTTIPQVVDKPIPTFANLRADAGSDIINVQFTLPPNPQVVWGATRQLRFQEGKEQVRANLLKALRDKYGMESEEQPPFRLFWFLTEGGGAPPDPAALKAQSCSGGWDATGVNDNENETRTVVQAGSVLQVNHFGRAACDSLTIVRVIFQPSQKFGARQDDISMMVLSVTDGALATRAKAATDAAVSKVNQDKENRDRQQRQQQAPPKL